MLKDFSNLPLKISYDSGTDNILRDFYIPVLSTANRYDRIAGFFSSSTLAVAARGMEAFITNGGIMRLVTCPRLSSNDVEALKRATDSFDSVIYKNFITSYENISDRFELDHVKALGWMIANNLLTVKIAVVRNNLGVCSSDEIEQLGIMHQKVGILYDQAGNVLSFSGSNNESASGWMANTEEFKVFCSWRSALPYIEADIQRFDSFWDGTRLDVEIKDIPAAIKEKLIVESKDFKPEHIATKKYFSASDNKPKPKPKLDLFYYQNDAVNMWQNNNRSLLLQMATGTGKTRTAIGCLVKALKNTKPLLAVIACPQVTLSDQWKRDIDSLDTGITHSITLNGNVKNWQTIFNREMLKLKLGQYKHLVVYTTHQICSSTKFLEVITLQKFNSITKFLIGDEVHGMGADKTKNGLIDEYTYRLGLSATPQRWFDDAGSKLIEEYFGEKSFEFTIHDALTEVNPITKKNFLVKFDYEPCFVSLTDDEIEEYKKLTEKIIKSKRYMDDKDTYLQMLRFKRADIEKNAVAKYDELERILDSLGNDISNMIIFVSDAQIDNVVRMLGKRGISTTKFTQEQGTAPMAKYGGFSERDYIISKFKSKDYQVLVAIKCLDEGIDIPSADTAIIMASSTNPREYVQRIGRIIRQAPNKYSARIYDMILEPDYYRLGDDKLAAVERRIFEKEMVRVKDLSQDAANSVTVLTKVYKVLEESKL
ncbi:DEAD/DEAH box helicase family protein [uncultured Phascolarctobacterium sp.]|uniref:DEAD/DEAH box helicase family protein n=1 Tax=uncultured Phascolarctobacterium sp. TaxID=512296 RepID=UPI0025DF5A2D|nr:DEAD/DEAH box helicase family protein [uncultured Phascolarctobacterium sp.]